MKQKNLKLQYSKYKSKLLKQTLRRYICEYYWFWNSHLTFFSLIKLIFNKIEESFLSVYSFLSFLRGFFIHEGSIIWLNVVMDHHSWIHNWRLFCGEILLFCGTFSFEKFLEKHDISNVKFFFIKRIPIL